MSTPHEVARECAALRRRMAEAQALFDEGKHAEAYGYLRAGAGILLAHVDLQAGSGEQRTGAGAADVAGVRGAPSTDHASADMRVAAAPAAGEGTWRCLEHRVPNCPLCTMVSDAEAEAVADATCGAKVDSHVSRAYVGPGPERLAKRFPIMGGRRG